MVIEIYFNDNFVSDEKVDGICFRLIKLDVKSSNKFKG